MNTKRDTESISDARRVDASAGRPQPVGLTTLIREPVQGPKPTPQSGQDGGMALRGEEDSATRRAYEWTRSRILNGTFAGGTLLSEGQVASAVEVSRTPVREAFLQLAAEHMLELYPKRGALVVPVSTADLREVLIARRVVEPWAAATVAQRADRAGVVSTLRERLVAMSTIKDERALLEADREFHECLLAGAENQLLSQFYSTLRDRQIRGGVLALRHRPSRAGESLDEHSSIIDALERGDAKVASELSTAHVEATAIELGLASLS
jgi:DNA-binding GntR family transcriptional regulator